MSLPRAPDRLSDEMAAAIGHAVSAFGFLEEALKRAIFSLTRAGLGQEVNDKALRQWLRRMEEIADDTLGTLIDSFAAAMKQADIEGRQTLADDLRAIRLQRNLLCHASWRPGARPGQWHPTFINTRGERYPDDMDPAAVHAIHAETLRAARRVVSIMRGTGIDGEWAGHDGD
ncbi:hypothetical protein EYF88_14045 [Paracoccus sediminis]|uniref:Uncharacterized protein n=1 Tax=Paracoccus sediminis TaxID=1214787 RepID=A0A238XPY7_9RHOB|nr:hypothetical protein [Paracoccus sediminis]TBN48189.1 hypothetical protein EYF88_14045 [Paracoccus sediminis]SNR60404.1 hypothetical protein SAMN06265378_11146 [Paracoccus sediminis]